MELQTTVYQTDREMIAMTYLYDDGWTYTFSVEVRVAAFSGTVEFNLQKSSIEGYISSCDEVYIALVGSVFLKDEATDYYISMVIHQKQRVSVNGRVGGYHDKNSMQFEFRADPSIFSSFSNALNRLI